MNTNADHYVQNREMFLQRLSEKLPACEMVAAAWLTGSFSRGQQDTLSDIDITLVIFDEFSPTLCVRPRVVSAQTTKERYELFSSFGKPAFLHENNHNAPEGGTFTFVAYAQTAVMVDWILRPLSTALRPEGALLLFEKVSIPVQTPTERASQEERAEEASQMMAFFWMMAAVTVKYTRRGEGMFVNTWLETLTNLVEEIERQVKPQPWQYQRSSAMKLSTTPRQQIAALRQLCHQMESLGPDLARLGGTVPESPMYTIETLLSVVEEATGAG
jgi:hypothetical protein